MELVESEAEERPVQPVIIRKRHKNILLVKLQLDPNSVEAVHC